MKMITRHLNETDIASWEAIKAILSEGDLRFDLDVISEDSFYKDAPCLVSGAAVEEVDHEIAFKKDPVEIPYMISEGGNAFPAIEGAALLKGEFADGFYGILVQAYDLIESYNQTGGLAGEIKAYSDDGDELFVEITTYKKVPTVGLSASS